MKLNIYSIQDSMAVCFLNPFTCVNDDVAKRTVSNAMASPDSSLSGSPEDYQLFRVGSFDTSSGLLDSLPVVALVSPLMALKKG